MDPSWDSLMGSGRKAHGLMTFANDALPCELCFEQRGDCETTAAPDDGTYSRLWPTAVVLSRYLCAHPDLVRGKRVVELGAGSGAVGLVCAALGAEYVCLTDVPSALHLLEANAARNAAASSSSRVGVAPCTWGDAAHIEALLAKGGAFDVVVACEVVYKQDEEVLQALAATQDALLSREGDGALVLFAYEFRCNMVEDWPYFAAAEELFDVELVQLREYEAGLAQPGTPEDDCSRTLYRYSRRRPAPEPP